jgi:hypothetical protein
LAEDVADQVMPEEDDSVVEIEMFAGYLMVTARLYENEWHL